MERLDLRGLTEEEIGDVCRELGVPRFRASQLFSWVQAKAVGDWEEVRNIGKADRGVLQTRLLLRALELRREQRSADGTRKYLFQLADGETIECVLMDYDRITARDRRTVCLSTQVGCPVGCSFCATGQGGLRRNLSPAEITGQVLDITRLMRREDPDFRVTNLVFMGMGEPLLNYANVLKAIRILNSQHGQNIGMRRMTISTSGVVPRIRDLARDNPQIGLAVSLHAATDEARDALVPMNRRYPLRELMMACREYTELTHRRVTFEVALISGQCSREMAGAMAQLLAGQLAHVNLIPVNPVMGTGMERPSLGELQDFAGVLERAGIPVSIREERGTDIDAACGQLRRREEEN